MTRPKLPENIIKASESLLNALKLLDEKGSRLLIVTDENMKLLGTFTDGDSRRMLLRNDSLSESIERGYNDNSVFMYQSDFTPGKAFDICQEKKIVGLPIINEQNVVVDFYRSQLIGGKELSFNHLDATIPVVIMGGGKGSRLYPISDVFPKPLIPISGRPMVEHVMDYFRQFNLNNFYMTVNHKSDLIKAYFRSIKKDYQLEFVDEPHFMGTAGSISLIKDELKTDFIISNCDSMVKTDIYEAYQMHMSNGFDLTVITSIQHHQLNYGKINYKNGGIITSIEEKPELTIPINTGTYIANPRVLKSIKTDGLFHMTDLIEALIKNGQKVGCFFINDNEFVDFGQWEEYKKAVSKLL